MRERVVNIRRIRDDVKESLKYIFAAVIIVGFASCAISKLLANNSYEAIVEYSISINYEEPEGNGINVYNTRDSEIRLLQDTCLSLTNSSEFINRAIPSTGYTELDYRSMEVDSQKKQGSLNSLSVITDDPNKSLKLVESIGRELSKTLAEISSDYSIVFISEPAIEEAPRLEWVYGIMGAIAAFLVAVLFITLKGLTTLDLRGADDISLITDIDLITILKRKDVNWESVGNCLSNELLHIKNTLEWTMGKQESRGILFVGADDSDNKDIVAANVAAALAKSGCTILLIDADLNKGTLTNRFGQNHSAGIADALCNKIEVKDCIVKQDICDTKFDFIASGNLGNNAMDAKSASIDRIREIVSGISNKYDFAIISSGNADSNADAVQYAYLFETVIVATENKTKLTQLKNALERLSKSRKLLGIVLYE